MTQGISFVLIIISLEHSPGISYITCFASCDPLLGLASTSIE